MHVLYIERQFPAHFGQVARYLVRHHGYQCTFACEKLPGTVAGFGPVQYVPDFPAGIQIGTRPAPAPGAFNIQISTIAPPAPAAVPAGERNVEGIRLIEYPAIEDSPGLDNLLTRGQAIFETLKAHPEIKPDLVVGSAIYASTLFLPDLYSCPVINYFDYYYRKDDSYLGFRPEFPLTAADIIAARAHNSLVLLDLQACAVGYTPTDWQRGLLPADYKHKIAAIFDGVDRDYWHRRQVERKIGNRAIPLGMRVVTYVARGLEALRGFDIFMKVAQRICRDRQDVVFVVVGSDSFAYGPDRRYIAERTFLKHVLKQDTYDLNRFIFTGRLPSAQLLEIFSLSDLHIYLTAPFVLSWSLLDALACGCTVLASDTSPVREIVRHEQTGLVAPFFDVDALTNQALRVLDSPDKFRALGEAGMRLIDEKYSLKVTVPQMIELYQRALKGRNQPPDVLG